MAKPPFFRSVPVLSALCVALVGSIAVAEDEPSHAEKVEALKQLDVTLKELGRSNYVRYCAACHGMEGKGDGLVAKALDPPPPDLTRIKERRGGTVRRLELIEIVDGRESVAAHGSRDMPVWGERLGSQVDEARRDDFVRGQAQVIVHYLLSIQEEAQTASP